MVIGVYSVLIGKHLIPYALILSQIYCWAWNLVLKYYWRERFGLLTEILPCLLGEVWQSDGLGQGLGGTRGAGRILKYEGILKTIHTIQIVFTLIEGLWSSHWVTCRLPCKEVPIFRTFPFASIPLAIAWNKLALSVSHFPILWAIYEESEVFHSFQVQIWSEILNFCPESYGLFTNTGESVVNQWPF